MQAPPRISSDDAIRDLAHDLRQPLSAIEAIAYYLEMTLPADQLDARQHLLRVQQLIEHSSAILARAVSAAGA
jgi:signal transduction histidine kinase